MAHFDVDMNERIINEEYKLWKKNSPFLYDIILSSTLEWPSLTVEWLPDKKLVTDSNDIDYSIQRLILSTHTNGTEQDYLLIAQIKLPTIDPKKLSEKYKHSCDVYGGFGGAAGKFEIIQKIPHNGEANRARYMPHNANVIATKTDIGHVNVFDRRKYTNKPSKNSTCKPTLTLRGHAKGEGYGLEWNKYREGYLLSSSDDGTICLWDIKQTTSDTLHIFKPHNNNNNGKTNGIEDISWHQRGNGCGDIFASVGDDKCISLWDLRNGNANNMKPIGIKKNAHKSGINCVEFSPFNEHLLITGGGDNSVCLWDKRNLDKKLHSLEGHSDEIFRVSWSPHSEVHLASSSADRRVMIWDLSQIGHEQASDEAEDGPPELMFIHGGHRGGVTDFSWNQNDPWVVVSIAANNVMQCWQMTDELLTFDDCSAHVQLE